MYYDIALLSGARINQIQKMKDEDDDEETQALIRKQEKTLLKVLKYKLKDRWPFVKKPDFWDLQQNNANCNLHPRIPNFMNHNNFCMVNA